MIIKIVKFIIRKILKKNILKEVSLSKKFTKIYKINYWSDPETVSGPGSATRNTTELISKINNIIDEYNIKSIVDAPCGDLSWMKKILHKRKIKYTGIDIVEELIKKNKILYANKNINFYKIDITKKKIPNADLLINRDCLFHLSFSDIQKFIKNLSKSKIKYFLTSNHFLPNQKNNFINKDIISGDFRKINLFTDPFNFNKNYLKIIKDDCDGTKKYLILFKKNILENF